MKIKMASLAVALAVVGLVGFGAHAASAQSAPYATPDGPYVSLIGRPLLLTALATTEIESYRWDFGDGSFASGPVVSKAYFTPGIYTVSLTVTTTGGQTSTVATPARIYAFRTTVVPYPCAVTTTATLPEAGPSDIPVIVTRCLYGVPVDQIEIPAP